MNMQITARDVRTYAEQIANRKEVRNRLYGRHKSVNRIREILAPPSLTSDIPRGKPSKAYTEHDAHMRVWRLVGFNILQSTTTRFVIMRGLELGVTHEQLISHGRAKYLCDIRHLIMWEVYETCGKSTIEIGRMFNRDPSTVHHAITKMNALRERDAAKAVENGLQTEQGMENTCGTV